MIPEAIWVVLISAGVSAITSVLTTLLTPILQARLERSKVRAANTYPKALEAITNLHLAFVDAYDALSIFSTSTLRELANAARYSNVSAAVRALDRARSLARPYLDDRTRLTLARSLSTFYEANILIAAANAATAAAQQVAEQGDKTVKSVQPGAPEGDSERQALEPQMIARMESFNWDDVYTSYRDAVEVLAPLLKP